MRKHLNSALFSGFLICLGFVSACSNGDKCKPTNPQFLQYCEEGVLYWIDDCAEVTSLIDHCACGCANNASCKTDCGCVPQCAGRCCGDDGCGGQCPDSCGTTGQTCKQATCQCEGSCTPQTCEQKQLDCGNWPAADGCGGDLSCGACPAGSQCDSEGHCQSTGCPNGLVECNGQCVDTSTDARNCGTCNHPCQPGQVCENKVCVAGPDCNTEPCTGLTYCDILSGQCLPGCISDSQCVGANEVCNPQTHDCDCQNAYHRCNGTCVSNNDLNSCGASCDPCPQVAHANATCNGVNCGYQCLSGYRDCGGVCALCANQPGVAAHTCQGTACVVASCSVGYALCDDGCCPWWFTPVASGAELGRTLEMELDRTGRAILAFVDYSDSWDDFLRLALPTSTSYEVLSTFPQYDIEVDRLSMTLDLADRPWIYVIDGWSDVLMWRQMGADWASDEHFAGVGVSNVDFAMADDGTLHILYFDEDETDTVYASYDGESWTTEVLDGYDSFASVPFDIKLDSLNQPHVVYQENYSSGSYWRERWWYRTRSGGVWTAPTMVTENHLISNLAMAIDSQNRAHVVIQGEDGDLLYAMGSAAFFQPSALMNGAVGYGPDIAVDDNGYPHLAWANANDAGLTYAWRDANGWHSSTIENSGEASLVKIRLHDGQPHVGYKIGNQIKLASLQMPCAGANCSDSCDVGQHLCSGSCRDTVDNAQSCGDCTTTCQTPAGGTAYCANDTCGGTCDWDAGELLCGNACTDILENAQHCGGCGFACGSPAVYCRAGRCTHCSQGVESECGSDCCSASEHCPGMYLDQSGSQAVLRQEIGGMCCPAGQCLLATLYGTWECREHGGCTCYGDCYHCVDGSWLSGC